LDRRHEDIAATRCSVVDLSAKVAALEDDFRERRGEVSRAVEAVDSLAAQISALEERREDFAAAAANITDLSAKAAALEDNFRELRGEVSRDARLVDSLAERLGALEQCHEEAAATAGRTGELSAQVAAVGSGLRELRDQHSRGAGAVEALSAQVGALERWREDLAATAHGVEDLSVKVAALEDDLRERQGEPSRDPGVVDSLSARTEALERRQDDLAATARSVAALAAQVQGLSGQVESLDAAAGERQEGAREAAGAVESLFARVTALDDSVQECRNELTEAAGNVKALSSWVEGLDGGVREYRQELSQTAVDVKTLSSQVAEVEESVQACHRELADTGGRAAKASHAADSNGESGAYQADAVELLSVQVRELSEAMGSVKDLPSGIASLTSSLEEQRDEVARLYDAVRALSATVLEDGRSEARLQTQLPKPTESALSSIVGGEALRHAELEDPDVPPEDVPSVEEVEQALLRLQATCSEASQAVATAARHELAALRGTPGFLLPEGEDGAESLDDRGLLHQELRQLEERLHPELPGPAGPEGRDHGPPRLPEEVLASLEGPLDRRDFAENFGHASAGLDEPPVFLEGDGLFCAAESLELSNLAWDGGPGADEAERAELVDAALERLHAACVEAAQGIAATARRELLKLELEPSELLPLAAVEAA